MNISSIKTALMADKKDAPVKAKSVKPSNSKPKKREENPYLNARQEWNDHTRTVVSDKRMWQIVGLISLFIAMACIGGMIHFASQSKFIPYLVEVNELGQVQGVGLANQAIREPKAKTVMRRELRNFVENARRVTPDNQLQNKAIQEVYFFIADGDPAKEQMDRWYTANGDESSPFKRSTKELVDIEIKSILPLTQKTWQVEWLEKVMNRKGQLKRPPIRMRANITVYQSDGAASTQKELQENPLGIYVYEFSWSEL